MKIHHKVDYRIKRVEEYPPVTEFADALYWKEQGDPTKYEAWLARCAEVKARFPKPPESETE